METISGPPGLRGVMMLKGEDQSLREITKYLLSIGVGGFDCS